MMASEQAMIQSQSNNSCVPLGPMTEIYTGSRRRRFIVGIFESFPFSQKPENEISIEENPQNGKRQTEPTHTDVIE